jgi:hypothetical protein
LARRAKPENRNLVGNIYGRSSIKIAHFVPIRQQTLPPQAILVSDWLISKKKSSPLKPPGQMNQHLVGSILGRSSIKTEKIFKNQPIRNKNLPVAAMFVNGSEQNEQSL